MPRLSGTYNKELGAAASVVSDLVSKLFEDDAFKIYADRFFSSVSLAELLKFKGIGFTGIIKSNRTAKAPLVDPKVMSKRPRGRYDICLEESRNLLLVTWNNNTVVLLLLTIDAMLPLAKGTWWISKEKKKMPVDQPDTISKCHQLLGGVDRMDQNIDNYRISMCFKK